MEIIILVCQSFDTLPERQATVVTHTSQPKKFSIQGFEHFRWNTLTTFLAFGVLRAEVFSLRNSVFFP